MAANEDSKCWECDYDVCNGANENIVKFWVFILALIIVMNMREYAKSMY